MQNEYSYVVDVQIHEYPALFRDDLFDVVLHFLMAKLDFKPAVKEFTDMSSGRVDPFEYGITAIIPYEHEHFTLIRCTPGSGHHGIDWLRCEELK